LLCRSPEGEKWGATKPQKTVYRTVTGAVKINSEKFGPDEEKQQFEKKK